MFVYKHISMEFKCITWTNNQDSTLPDSTVVAEKGLPLEGHQLPKFRLDLLQPLRQWLERIEIHNPKEARFFCKVIPTQCPFEHDIKLFGCFVAHIPPLCKLNPFYEQLVGLRLRSLCYLVEQRGEVFNPNS